MKKIMLLSAFQTMYAFGYEMKKMISIATVNSLFFGVFLLFSCSKGDKVDKNTPSSPLPERTSQFKADPYTVKPGMIVTLTSEKVSDISQITIILGGKQVPIAKIDSFKYAFCMPVVPPGTYTLDLIKLKSANNPSLTVSDYTIIANPTNTIVQTINYYNKIADSLVAVGITSIKEGEYMHQLTNQLSEYMNNADADQKQLIAYQAQSALELTNSSVAKLRSPIAVLPNNTYKITRDKNNSSYTTISSFANNHAKTSVSGNNPFDWINLSLDNSTEFSDKSNKANIASSQAIFALRGGLTGFVLAGYLSTLPQITPIPGMLIGASATGVLLTLTAIVLKSKAKRLNEEIANEEYVPEHIENSDSNTPIVFSKAEEIIQKLTGGFRNITKSDENTSNQEIAGYIKSNDELASTDNKIKTKIDEIKAKFGFLLSKIAGTYNAYISPVLIKAKEKTKRLLPKYITISNISNPDIDIHAGEDAYQQLRLSVSNYKNNIKTKVSFTYTTTYTQPATGKKVSITQQAIFNGVEDQLPDLQILTGGSSKKWLVTKYLDGNGQNQLGKTYSYNWVYTFNSDGTFSELDDGMYPHSGTFSFNNNKFQWNTQSQYNQPMNYVISNSSFILTGNGDRKEMRPL